MPNSKTISNEAINKTAKNVDDHIRNMRIRLIESIFNDIVDHSPIVTGFYASNHLILEENESFETIERREDAHEGEFVEDIEINRTRQLAKLKELGETDKVTIANPVSYASEVESKHGVYQKAIKAGTQRAKSLLKEKDV